MLLIDGGPALFQPHAAPLPARRNPFIYLGPIYLTLIFAFAWFGAAKAGQRLEEAQAAEAAVLDRMGFDSWADYRLGIPSAPRGGNGRHDQE